MSLTAIIERSVKEYHETAYWDCAAVLQPSLVLSAMDPSVALSAVTGCL